MPVQPGSELRFICFSDGKRPQAPGWELRPLVSPPRLVNPHDINRFHKVFPHRLFPGKRWSIYIDGNIRFAGDWACLVQTVQESSVPLGAFRHPQGRNLVEEVDACRRYGKFDAFDGAAVERQLAFYRREGFDLTTTISANYLLVRDHAFPGLDAAMSLWWSHFFEFSKRDQISLQYALHRNGLSWTALDGPDGVDAALLTRLPHHRPAAQRARIWASRRVGSLLRRMRAGSKP
jgi:hypothetical protein